MQLEWNSEGCNVLCCGVGESTKEPRVVQYATHTGTYVNGLQQGGVQCTVDAVVQGVGNPRALKKTYPLAGEGMYLKAPLKLSGWSVAVAAA